MMQRLTFLFNPASNSAFSRDAGTPTETGFVTTPTSAKQVTEMIPES